MPHTIHLRITPADLSGITLEAIVAVVSGWSDTWAIYQEHEDTNLHYHIGIENVKCSEKTCRNHINDSFQLPKNVRGQESKYYALKYDKYKEWDIAYVAKDGTQVAYSGYTPEFLEVAEMRGALKWPKKIKPRQVDAAAIPAGTAAASVPKKESEFERLVEAFELRPNHMDATMEQIKRWINSFYLKQRKCIPRLADSARYAYSIYAIYHEKVEEDDDVGLHATALISGLNNI